MANYNQAPTLEFNGKKKQSGEKNYYAIPQDLADIIFQELGNASAQLRIMLVLIGTKPGFKVSDAWICERTGLLHASYITARKALIKRGWLTLNPAKEIVINYDIIYARSNTILPQNNCSNTILPQGGNTTLPQCSNTILPITNKTDNKTDEVDNSSQRSELSTSCENLPAISQKELDAIGARYEITEDKLFRIIDTGKLFRMKEE